MFYHVIKSYLLVNNCILSFQCFCFKLSLLYSLRCFQLFEILSFPAIYEDVFITKCSALVYINSFVCGLKNVVAKRACKARLTAGYGIHWQWGAVEAAAMALRLTVNRLHGR